MYYMALTIVLAVMSPAGDLSGKEMCPGDLEKKGYMDISRRIIASRNFLTYVRK